MRKLKGARIRRAVARGLGLTLLCHLAWVFCDQAVAQNWPQTARKEIVKQLWEDKKAIRGPSDGGGKARIVSGTRAEAGKPGAWEIEYEAGSLGVGVGGSVQFQVSPFWGWSSPQTEAAGLLGYTTVTTDVAGISLSHEPCGQGCVAAKIKKQPLPPGGHIVFFYGKGASGALADQYAEHGERFFLRVDGDGDGTGALIAESPSIDVKAGPPVRLIATIPSTAKTGKPIPMTAAFLDARANAAGNFVGQLRIKSPPGLAFPASVMFEAGDRGRKRIVGKAVNAGIYRAELEADGGMRFTTNPIEVTKGEPRHIRWGDLQGHSNLSDGTGSLDDYYSYARDVAGLDVTAVTDHDHWGFGFLDQRPEAWEMVKQAAERYYEPGRFVTLAGYEWTSWIYGHRHVLYFSASGKLYSSLDPATDTPRKLWDALRASSTPVMTVPHHPAGGPVAIDWSIPPDPLLEPLVEIVSVHGSSECAGSPGGIYHPEPGHFACDALGKGYRLGMIGSGDGHDGHPGLNHLRAPSGGLAAIITDDLTRGGILSALRSRRTYATNGERMILEFRLGAHPMGSVADVTSGETGKIYVGRAIGTRPITRLELVKNGVVVSRVAEGHKPVSSILYEDTNRKSGDYVYLRAFQEGGGMAWSSPIWSQ